VRGLGAETMRLERCYGVSLLWLLRGSGQWTWGTWLDGRPPSLARAVLTALDRVAFRAPSLADMIVSVWRPNQQARQQA